MLFKDLPRCHMILKIRDVAKLSAEVALAIGKHLQFGKGAESQDAASAPVHESADHQGRAAALSGR